MGDDLAALAALVGHDFERPRLLAEAVTHASAADAAAPSFERLEFLGDRVLGLVVAELLMAQFPDEAEGALTRRYHALARKEAARDVGQALGLARFLRVAPGEDAVRENSAAVADAVEAVIAALYLDGGMAPARAFIVKWWQPILARTLEPPRDAKTALQVRVQQQGLALPVYTEVARTGPPHAPHFVVEVTVGGAGELRGRGEGSSKRAAQQAAAAAVLAQLGDG